MPDFIALTGVRKDVDEAIQKRNLFWALCENELLELATSKVQGDSDAWFQASLNRLEQEMNTYQLAKSWLHFHPYEGYERFKSGRSLSAPEDYLDIVAAKYDAKEERGIEEVIQEFDLALSAAYQENILKKAVRLLSGPRHESLLEDAARDAASMLARIGRTVSVYQPEKRAIEIGRVLLRERIRVVELEEMLLSSSLSDIRDWFTEELGYESSHASVSNDGMRGSGGVTYRLNGNQIKYSSHLKTLSEAQAWCRAYYPARLVALENFLKDSHS